MAMVCQKKGVEGGRVIMLSREDGETILTRESGSLQG
jgi:hypothetical protein